MLIVYDFFICNSDSKYSAQQLIIDHSKINKDLQLLRKLINREIFLVAYFLYLKMFS